MIARSADKSSFYGVNETQIPILGMWYDLPDDNNGKRIDSQSRNTKKYSPIFTDGRAQREIL